VQLPVSYQVIVQELDSVKTILAKWQQLLTPAVTAEKESRPYFTEEEMGMITLQLVGELSICAGKCENLSNTIAEHV
jgi:hypothetical protein